MLMTIVFEIIGKIWLTLRLISIYSKVIKLEADKRLRYIKVKRLQRDFLEQAYKWSNLPPESKYIWLHIQIIILWVIYLTLVIGTIIIIPTWGSWIWTIR